MATILGALVGNTLAIDDVTGTIDSYAVPIDLMLADQATFYAADISQGLSIGGALFTNSPTFYAGTVTASYDISAALYVNTGAVYAATMAPGAVTIAGALVQGSTAFYGAAVVADGGAQSITGALAANDNQFFAASVSEVSTRRQGWDDGGPRREWAPNQRRQKRIVFYEEPPKPEETRAEPPKVRRVPKKLVKKSWDRLFGNVPAPVPPPPVYVAQAAPTVSAAQMQRELETWLRARAAQIDDEEVELLLLAA